MSEASPHHTTTLQVPGEQSHKDEADCGNTCARKCSFFTAANEGSMTEDLLELKFTAASNLE